MNEKRRGESHADCHRPFIIQFSPHNSESVDSFPFPLVPKTQKDADQPQNPRLRQRNIQIKAMESMDRTETEEDEDSSPIPKRRVNFDEKTSQPSEEEEIDTSVFDTYLVIEFAKNVNSKSLHWIVDKIRGKKIHGGAELLLRKEPSKEYDKWGTHQSF